MHRIVNRPRALRVERLEDRVTPTTRFFATGEGAGGQPLVHVYSLDTPTSYHLVASFMAYDPAFRGGVNVATADLNGDGVDEVITGAGPGGGPHVEVYDGASLLKGQVVRIRSFAAYAPTFSGGVYVAGSLHGYNSNGQSPAAIVTGAGAGGAPHVRVFDFQTLTVVRQFFAYDPRFTGGVRVAVDPLAGVITTGAGPGGGPHVKVYNPDGSLYTQFSAFDPTFTGGVFVSVGNIATPNGGPFADTAVAPGAGGPSEVRLFDTIARISTPVVTVTPYPNFGGGISATITQDNQNFNSFLLTAPGALGGPDVRVYEGGDFKPVLRFNAYDPSFLGGVQVG